MGHKRKVFLALSLMPAAALLLPGFAVKSAQAACTGPNANGTWTCTNGTNPPISVPTGITVTPSGANTFGIDATLTGAGQGAVLTVSDTVIKNQNQFPGVNVLTSAGNDVGIGMLNPAGGTGSLSLTMNGTNSIETWRGTGILVNNRGSGNSTAIISGNLTVHSLWNKTIEGQDGVEVDVASGKATLDMSQANATITVEGGGNGILLRSWTRTVGSGATEVTYSGGSVTGNIGPNVQIVVNEPPGLTRIGTDVGTNGIYAYVDAGTGTVDLTTAAAITTTGAQANGILAYAVDGNVTVHNGYTTTDNVTFTAAPGSGAISTTGDNSNGILAYANAGKVSVFNTGAITPDGAASDGINAYTTANANPAGDVSVDNSGVINSGTLTPGNNNDSGGILAYSTTAGAANTGKVNVINIAAITVDGNGSEGIHAYTSTTGTGTGAASDVTVNNSGVIKSGTNSDPLAGNANSGGILAYSTGAGATGTVKVTNSGDITVEGNESEGIHAYTQATGAVTAGNVLVDNSGNISSGVNTPNNNANSDAIYAVSEATGTGNTGTVTVTNTFNPNDQITAAGDNSAGIRAVTKATGTGNAGDVTVTSTGGTITANEGKESYGIYAESKAASASGETGTVSVTNTSTINTDGTSESDGIHAESLGVNGTVFVDNSGAITTSGSGGDNEGIYAVAAKAVEVINGGDIITRGTSDSAGIVAMTTGTGTVDVTNSAAITTEGTGDKNYGIYAQAADGPVTVGSTGLTITTAGLNNSAGIYAESLANGAVGVTNSSAITTNGLGDSNYGIFAQGTAGVTVGNTGGITTAGATNSAGIFANSTEAGAVNVTSGTGAITTNGSGADSTGNYGIYAQAASGPVTVGSTGPSITTNGANDSAGIYAESLANGAVGVTNSAAITTNGSGAGSTGNYGIFAQGTAGVTVGNTGGITTNGATNSAGIFAKSTEAGAVGVTNSSVITTNGLGDSNYGIAALAMSGAVTVASSGPSITTAGLNNSAGIYALSANGNVGVTNSSVITTNGLGYNNYGIYALAADGAVTVNSTSPSITTAGLNNSAGIYAVSFANGNVGVTNNSVITTKGTGTGNYGIVAAAFGGDVEVNNDKAITTSGDTSHAILADSVDGVVAVINSGILTTSGPNANGIQADTQSGAISITNNAKVTSQQGVGVLATATGNASFLLNNQAPNGNIFGATAGVRLSNNFASATIANAGTIGAANDFAIDTSALTSVPVRITNSGTINGYMTLGPVANMLTNEASGIWNLQNSNPTTNGVAVADMGSSATITNSGTIYLLGNAPNAAAFNPAGTYLPLAVNTVAETQLISNPNNDPASGGRVQGQILGVATFNDMGGTIDLATKNSAAGDVLVISGGHTPGVDGGGVFVTGGGTVKLNAVLNEGGANAQSDILVVDSTRLGAGGATNLYIVPSGNSAQTVGNGIPVVEVLNKGASDPGAFVLGNEGQKVRVVNGLYEYDLHQNGIGADAADGNWYLRSVLDPNGNLAQRPEPYLYTRNMATATGMFMHTLHDRLGEPQFTGIYGGDKDNEKNNVPAVWGRVSYTNAHSESAGGRMDLGTESTLVHIGGDIAHWSNDNNRFHLGLMGAYGRSNTDVEANDVRFTNNGLPRKANGWVEGYSLGVYGTWYGNDKQAVGPYIDLWAMYGWYDNTVKGIGLPRESYNSTAGTVSIEGGYAFMLHDGQKRQLMLEPQAQIAYTLYSQDDHVEANGTRVTDDDGDAITTRLGARLFLRGKEVVNAVQPFVEGNWWYSTANNRLNFNGVMVEDGAPNSRYEAKIGLEGEMGKHWHAWAHVGGMWGSDNYSRYEGMAGLKYVW